jgi:hypothetical protein
MRWPPWPGSAWAEGFQRRISAVPHEQPRQDFIMLIINWRNSPSQSGNGRKEAVSKA